MGNIISNNFEEDISKLPEADVLKENLNKLWVLDKSNLSLDEIQSNYFKYAKLLTHTGVLLDAATINKLTVFRSRINVNEQNEDVGLIRTFSYPSTDFCKQNGRANIKGTTVFYGADTVTSAIAEIRPKADDLLYVGAWKINCNRECMMRPCISMNLPQGNPWTSPASKYFKKMVDYATSHRRDYVEQLILLYDFIAEIFEKEPAPYYLSSWLANRALYGLKNFDFLVYPSFALNSNRCNLAFHPNFVDQFFQLHKVFKLRITEISKETAYYSILKVGLLRGSHIIWQPPSSENLEYLPGKPNKKE